MTLVDRERAASNHVDATSEVLASLRVGFARRGYRIWRIHPNFKHYATYGPYTVINTYNGRVVHRALTLERLQAFLEDRQGLPGATVDDA